MAKKYFFLHGVVSSISDCDWLIVASTLLKASYDFIETIQYIFCICRLRIEGEKVLLENVRLPMI